MSHGPTFNPELVRHSKLRMNSYLKELRASFEGAGNSLFKKEDLDKLADEIGSVGTGRDNQPKKKKPVFRSLDDDWES